MKTQFANGFLIGAMINFVCQLAGTSLPHARLDLVELSFCAFLAAFACLVMRFVVASARLQLHDRAKRRPAVHVSDN